MASNIFAKLENLAKQLLHPKKPVAKLVRLDGIKLMFHNQYVMNAQLVLNVNITIRNMGLCPQVIPKLVCRAAFGLPPHF